MASKFEKAFEQMTPEQRRKISEQISEMMGMPPEKMTKRNRPKKDNTEEDAEKGLERYVDQPGQ